MSHMLSGYLAPGALQVSVELKDGRWINFAGTVPGVESLWSQAPAVSILLMAVAVIFLSVWVVRRLTRPIRGFASAAERLGKDVDAPPLVETGPSEVRQASRAFNKMQERLKRFIENRTRMLAAISHDLRTPITLLRLRAELNDDAGEQAKIIATLDEMEAMIAATLAFARQDAEAEQRRAVDVAALLESICNDMTYAEQ